MKIMLIGSLIVFVAVYFVFRHIIGSTQGWSRVSGEVVRSDVKLVTEYDETAPLTPRTRFEPDVHYRYSLGGQTFAGYVFYPRLERPSRWKRSNAEAIAARFPVGATVPVYIREGSGGVPLGSSWGACLAHLVAAGCDRFRDSHVHSMLADNAPEIKGQLEDGPIACLVPDYNITRRDAIAYGVYAAAAVAFSYWILLVIGNSAPAPQNRDAHQADSVAVECPEQTQVITEPALPWRGIVIQAPEQIVGKRRDPAPSVPLIGFYRIDATANTEAGLMLFVRDQRNMLLSFRVTFDNDPSPVDPPPPHQAMDPKPLEGVTTASHFSLDLNDYIVPPTVNTDYKVYLEFAGMRSNVSAIQYHPLCTPR